MQDLLAIIRGPAVISYLAFVLFFVCFFVICPDICVLGLILCLGSGCNCSYFRIVCLIWHSGSCPAVLKGSQVMCRRAALWM